MTERELSQARSLQAEMDALRRVAAEESSPEVLRAIDEHAKAVESARLEVMAFIATIPDARIRAIAVMRFLECRSWETIARRKMSESHKGKPSTFKGKHHSAETRRKISEAGKRAYLNNPELRRKTSEANKKRHISPETRRKISEANKGKHISPESRLKFSEAKKGQTPWNKGKKGVQHISSETRRKMSESHKCTSLSPETRKKMSESIKRAYLNPELRLKISEARKKSVICVETGTLYSSVTEAAESIGVTGGAISGVLRGAHKTSGGYHWKYAD